METNRRSRKHIRKHSRLHRQIIYPQDILIMLQIISPQDSIRIPHKWFVRQHRMENRQVEKSAAATSMPTK
jgi:hypothetical protein